MSTRHEYDTGAETFPAWSRPVTVNVCTPFAKPEYAFGDEHDDAAAPSSEQVKVTGGLVASDPVKLNDAEVDATAFAGFEVNDTTGGVVSGATVIDSPAVADWPELSATRTVNELEPAAVGVPVITPDTVRVSPGGSAPDDTVQVIGASPPTAIDDAK